MKLLATLFVISMFSSYAHAQMSAKWVNERERLLKEGKASCNSTRSFNTLKKAADEGDPIAAYWVYYSSVTRKCRNYKKDTSSGQRYLMQSVQSGYPVATSALGKNLLYGYSGFARNKKRAALLLDKAYKLGWANAGGVLAYAYGKGNVLPYSKDKALAYFAGAIRKGMNRESASTIITASRRSMRKEAQKVYRTAFAGKSNQPSSSASSKSANVKRKISAKPSSKDDANLFAALVVSRGDGGYGYAHDYKNKDKAVERAKSECQRRGGRDCQTAIVGRGKGCIAYHHNGNSSSAYGWAVGRSRGPVEDRAASECQVRNGEASCNNTSWACNDRTRAPLKVVYQKKLPAIETTAAAACHIILRKSVCNFDRRKSKRKLISFVRINAPITKTIAFEQCGQKRYKGIHITMSGRRAKHLYGKYIPDNIYKKVKDIAVQFGQAVEKKYGKCATKKRKNSNNDVMVSFYATEKQLKNSVRFSKALPSTEMFAFDAR